MEGVVLKHYIHVPSYHSHRFIDQPALITGLNQRAVQPRACCYNGGGGRWRG